MPCATPKGPAPASDRSTFWIPGGEEKEIKNCIPKQGATGSQEQETWRWGGREDERTLAFEVPSDTHELCDGNYSLLVG